MPAADTRGVWEPSLLSAHSLDIQKAWMLFVKNSQSYHSEHIYLNNVNVLSASA